MPRPDQRKHYGSIADAAEILGYSTKTIRRKIADGTIRGYRTANGRAIRVDLREVETQLLRPIPTGGDAA